MSYFKTKHSFEKLGRWAIYPYKCAEVGRSKVAQDEDPKRRGKQQNQTIFAKTYFLDFVSIKCYCLITQKLMGAEISAKRKKNDI